MHSEGILAGEMKHGPLALVDEHMPMIVLATQDRTCNKMHSVVQQLRARGACPEVLKLSCSTLLRCIPRPYCLYRTFCVYHHLLLHTLTDSL